MSVTYYCYPTCSTCKKAKKFLNSKNVEYHEIHLKNTPPTAQELAQYHRLSGLPLKRLFNTSGDSYRKLNLKETFDSLTETQAYELLATDGMLIKRPILVLEDKVFFGFKEDDWNDTLV